MRNNYSNSTLALKLISILDKSKGKEQSDSEIISALYSINEQAKEYSKFKNRYFKLRKKILDSLSQNGDSNHSLPEEEMQWNQIQQLLLKNEKTKALNLLLSLEKTCVEKNIFELLPKICDSIIFLNQSFNVSNQQKGLFKKMEQYICWQQAIAEINLCARKIHEQFVKQGIKGIRKELLRVKKITLKYPSLTRFKLCYNHLNLYYKLASPDHIQKKTGLGRYHNAFLNLYQTHPEIPLFSYRMHYKTLQRFHFLQIQIMFYYNRFEHQEALFSMEELWNLVRQDQEILGIYKTEPLYFNYISALIINKEYFKAEKIVLEFLESLEPSLKTDRSKRAYQELFIIYTLKNNLSKSQLGLNEKRGLSLIQNDSFEKSGSNQYFRNQLALMRWYLLQNKPEEALKLQNIPELGRLLKKIKLENVISKLIHDKKENQIPFYKLQINQPKHPEQYIMHQWLLKFILDK